MPPERIDGVTNSYVFEIDGAGTWLVAVADGKLTVSEGAGEADARFSMSEETFRKLVTREQSPVRAVMTRKLKISGDLGAAAKLQQLIG